MPDIPERMPVDMMAGEVKKPDYKGAIQKMLPVISFLESSGGKDTSHDPVTWGVNAGTTAVGDKGLMPRTMADVVRWFPHDFHDLQTADESQLADRASVDSKLYDRLARKYAEWLMTRFKGDVPSAVYSWRMGPFRKDTSARAKGHPYVEAFKKEYKKRYGEDL